MKKKTRFIAVIQKQEHCLLWHRKQEQRAIRQSMGSM